MRKDIEELWKLAEPYVNDAGFDLCEVQSGREQAGWVVRVFIDHPAPAAAGEAPRANDVLPSEPVSITDCERVSRDLSAALDVADLIPHAYQLEVSSPGLDRPLRKASDFARFAGATARIRLQDGVGGRRNFQGVLRGLAKNERSDIPQQFEIDCDGQTHRLSVSDVAKANIVPDWEREFKRSAS